MNVLQERLPTNKREPIDKWSVREKLCLAAAVAKSGDQNWISVSRVLKPFADPNRPIDWFHQKNCAAQYNWLLDIMDTPKRKKRELGCETPIEGILRKLTQERLTEIEKCLVEEKAEYLKMQEDMTLLKSGNVTMEMLHKWCREIDEENKRQEEEAAAHAQWLREREARKQEIERNIRPMPKPTNLGLSLKRKASDSVEHEEESSKPALSPLLTSLLKSPSQNISTNATILNTSIAGAAIKMHPPTSNPTIASILNSPNTLQQLALQEPASIASDMLEDVDSIKVDDLESSLLSDDPLPIMKNEDVEVIISNLIQDNVGDDLKLDDDSVDLITNLQNELDEYCKEEEAKDAATKMIDPFEFQEDPAICDVPKLSTFNGGSGSKSIDKILQDEKPESIIVPNQIMNTQLQFDDKFRSKELTSGSVEIVEVVMDGPTIDKQLNKTQIQNIVHCITLPQVKEVPMVVVTDTTVESMDVEQPNFQMSTVTDFVKDGAVSRCVEEMIFDELMKVTKHEDSYKRDYSRKKKDETNIDMQEAIDSVGSTDFDPLSFSNFDTPSISNFNTPSTVTFDTPSTINPDTPSTPIFNMPNTPTFNTPTTPTANIPSTSNFNTPSTSHLNVNQQTDENAKRIKLDSEVSNSPSIEEEDAISSRFKRRFSAPGTPADSLPTSPASSGAFFEDEREYRNWKKSVMLVYNRFTTHKFASLFLKPITDDHAPDYHKIILKPFDLQTIRKRIENGAIRNTAELQRDVLCMFFNASMYNRTGNVIHRMTEDMLYECVNHFALFIQAQQSDDAPQRRETRLSEPGNKRKKSYEEKPTRARRKKEVLNLN